MSSSRAAHSHPHPAESFTLDGLIATLRSEGLRITKGRIAILSTLLAAKEPLTLEKIQSLASTDDVVPDYATVFRVMTLLEQLGLAHKVHLERSSTYYELSDPAKHHDHIVCTDCGKVTLVEEPCPVGSFEKALAKKYGFTHVKHSLEFFGLCRECGDEKS